jgi:predicted exporter
MRWRLLALWVAGVAVLASYWVSQGRILTDLSGFLPQALSLQERVLLHQLREGATARMLLIAIGGDAPTRDVAAASRGLGQALMASKHFTWVANGTLDATARTPAELFEHRYLIGPAEQCVEPLLSESALRAALEARLEELAGPLPSLDKQWLAADPTACFRHLLLSMRPQTAPRRVEGVWFSPDGRRALLVARTAADASNLAAQREAVDDIRRAFALLPDAQGLRLELAGPAFFSVASEEIIRTETLWLSAAATVMVVLILSAAFRSVTLVLLGMLPLITGILAGAVVVSLVFGYLHGMALALATTLLGVAMDYPVHVLAHAVPGDTRRTLEAGISRTLFLGVTTTALGYAALALTSFQALAQLGLLSATGLGTAALCSRFLLPRLMPVGYRLPEHAWAGRWWRRLPVGGRRSLVLAVGVAGSGVVLALMLNPAPWDSDLSRLGTIPRSQLALDRTLREELGAPDVARLLFATGADREAVTMRVEAALGDLHALVDQGLIRAFDAIPRWLPSQGTQRERQARLPQRDALASALAAAGSDLPFRPQAFGDFLDAVQRARSQTPLTPADVRDAALGARLSALLQPFDGGWLALVPLTGVDDRQAEPALRGVADRHGLYYLDLRSASAELLDRFVGETLERCALALPIIALVLWVGLRDAPRFGRVMLPCAVALSLDFVLILGMEGSVNLFHLVSLLLVLGLAIDYGLFFSRPGTSQPERGRTFFALTICALSSFAMFAMLGLSGIPVLHAIGSTVAIGIALAYGLSLWLARPAVPAGTRGRKGGPVGFPSTDQLL